MAEELKPGWRRVKFGEVVRQVKDKVDPETSGLDRYIAGEHMDTDDLKLRRWGEIGADYLGPAFHMRFRPGQVLYGSRRTYLRKVAVADFEGITANTTFVLEPKDANVLLPELLPFLMQTDAFHEHSIKQSRGSVNPYVNFSDLAWYEFTLPPLEEQRRITRLLSLAANVPEDINAAIARHQEALQSAIDALIAELVPGSKRLSKLGMGGTGGVLSLDHVATVRDCKHRTPNFVDSGVPIIAPGDIRWGALDLSASKKVSESDYASLMDHVELTALDLVMGRNQSIGIAAYVKEGQRFALGQDTIHCV